MINQPRRVFIYIWFLCWTQVWTPFCLPSTSTTATWTVGWHEERARPCPTSSKSPRRASAACWRSRLRASPACCERSAPPRRWCLASPPGRTEPRTRCLFCHAAPLLVGNSSICSAAARGLISVWLQNHHQGMIVETAEQLTSTRHLGPIYPLKPKGGR